ncbi:MAG TPA: DUF1178 family protein [Acetobacteraceae bacterium]|jgi:hypothetical protein|nr:DUF1178 family protein [Acetobacteraceae bacterium]
MIHYALRCGSDHQFEGWFNDSASFAMQEERGLLECPTCGDKSVTRALMAPALPKPGQAKQDRLSAPAEPQKMPVKSGAKLPAEMFALLQRMRTEVEKRCDYVGPEFADEARRIHRGESDARGIYGETSPEQAEALQEEGIEIASIPWVPRADG